MSFQPVTDHRVWLVVLFLFLIMIFLYKKYSGKYLVIASILVMVGIAISQFFVDFNIKEVWIAGNLAFILLFAGVTVEIIKTFSK